MAHNASPPSSLANASPANASPAITSTAFVNERERVVQALAAHYAVDHLAMEEFEARLERAYEAASIGELQELLAGLPRIEGEPVQLAPHGLLAPASEVRPRGVVMAVLGGNGRKGSWIVPRKLKVIACLGGVELDLRDARFATGTTEIELSVFMGGVEILVPPGVRVETDSTAAFMGGIEIEAGDATALSVLHPLIRLSGFVLAGGVDARNRLPGESARDAKVRHKRERTSAKRRQGR